MRIWPNLKQNVSRNKILCNKGDLKITKNQDVAQTAPIAAAYKPKDVEHKKWKTQSCLNPQNNSGTGTFRMLLPPPNITGDLHLGHALMATIQDVICRHKRLMGYNVEWIPGVDHAGIATQVIVEKKLMNEQKMSRHQIGRESFVEEVFQWKDKKTLSIKNDLKKLGCTLNWEHEYFTMDESHAFAVAQTFIDLFEKDLIKRKNTLVNWSCALESTISDIEVETIKINEPMEIAVPGHDKNVIFGRIYDIVFKVINSNEEIIVSTTRPETILGDVAIAVNPTDERYKKFQSLGDVTVRHPLTGDTLPLIYDLAVDRDTGTGAVKITPAHDRFDFEIADKHMLVTSKEVFDEKGTILDTYYGFEKLPRFEARELILNKLSDMQLLRDVKDHAMNLPMCSRSKDIVEQMLKPQWFVQCAQLAERAASEVRSGRLQIVPSNFETEWFRWLDNCQDWCISRQLWWGHRIPAYLAKNEQGTECWIVALTEEEAKQKAKLKLGSVSVSVVQDEDVLDTWFSSALLPLTAYNWPFSDLKQTYPIDIMQTGHDILFFWVARMVMLGLHLTDEVPFKKILLNGIVCDSHGRKMSKSLGNVITPQQIILGVSKKDLDNSLQSQYKNGLLDEKEIKKSLQGIDKMFPNGILECGTDALRFTLCSYNMQNHFINFDVSECHKNKLFLNKIWQATRFTLGAAKKLKMPLHKVESLKTVTLSKWDRWILSRLASTMVLCADSYENHNLHVGALALKQFFYNNLCNVYLETTKTNIEAGNEAAFYNIATLATCLSWGLQMMAPYTPFIVEELLQYLPPEIELNLTNLVDTVLENEVEETLLICQTVRQLKNKHGITKKSKAKITIYANSSRDFEILSGSLHQIKQLTQSDDIVMKVKTADEKNLYRNENEIHTTVGHICSICVATSQLQRRPQTSQDAINRKKLEKLESDLNLYRSRVNCDGYLKKASEKIQKNHSDRIKKLEIEIENIKAMVL